MLVECPEFRVSRWESIHGRFTLDAPGYRLMTVIGGGGTLTAGDGQVDVGLGTSLVVPAGTGPVEAPVPCRGGDRSRAGPGA